MVFAHIHKTSAILRAYICLYVYVCVCISVCVSLCVKYMFKRLKCVVTLRE